MRPSQRSQSSGPLGRRASAPGTTAPPSTREVSAAGRRSGSRDSSGSREVRCACQFYQSDSLLPERTSLVGTRLPERAMGDHEYEPISPPPHALPSVRVTGIEGFTIQEPPEGPDAEPVMSDNDSVGSPVRKPVEELNVPYDGEEEDRAMSEGEMGDTNGGVGGPDDDAGPTSDLEEEDEMSVQQMQQQMEDRFFAETPTTTRTESRTDGELNTSQVDSSGLEDLPLTREGRKAAQAQASTSGEGSIQSRLRTGAGQLRTRLKNIKRPKMPQVKKPNMKFNMPAMPKRPEFKRPEFHLPERPKFKLPDRPKFNMPQRPKISLPSMGSLGRKSEPGKSNSTRRPLRQFSNESNAGSPERKPLFDFKTYPRMFKSKANKVRGASTSSSPKSARSATPPPRMLGADDPDKARKKSMGSRWVQRFTDIKFGEDDEAKRKKEKEKEKEKENVREERKPPEAAGQSTSRQGDGQLVYHISLHGSDSEPEYSDDQFPGPPYPELPIADDLVVMDTAARLAAMEAKENAEAAAAAARLAAEEEAAAEEARAVENARYAAEVRAVEAARSAAATRAAQTVATSATSATSAASEIDEPSHDTDLTEPSHSIPASPGDSDREQRSSGTSSERHRRGVLEEIDSDEFFLRQKGISQEDVDMTRFISSEIREALRAPGSNLSRMDYGSYDDEEELENIAVVHRNGGPPSRPTRTRSLRPRKKKGKKPIPPTPPGDEAEEEWDDEERQEPQASYFNTFPPSRPERNRRAKKTARQGAEDTEQTREDERIQRSVAIHREQLGILAHTPAADELVTEPPLQPPLPPKRLRKSVTTLGRDDDVPMIDDEDWGDDERRADREEVMALHGEVDYIIPRVADEVNFDPPPIPPTRGRKSRSRGTSLADEDRTSRGAESLPSERDVDSELQIEDDMEMSPRIDDYAFVDKSNVRTPPPKPERPRRPKPPRPPAPGRRKRATPQTTASRIHNWGKQFFTLPSRRGRQQKQKEPPPTRPTRNYSTLGPARPPRRSSRSTLREQHVYTAYLEIEDDPSHTESHESRDLQSGRVISKMKDRPLPAPPRPPRKSRDHSDFEQEDDEVTRRILMDQQLRAEREEEERELTYEERKAALAAMREEFFSQSAEERARADDLPTHTAQEIVVEEVFTAVEAPPQESPYKSLRKKKKVPPIPKEPELPPEMLSDPPEETMPQAPPDEVSVAIQTDPLPDDMCVEDSVMTADDISRTEGTTTTSTSTWPTVIEADQTEAEDIPSVATVLQGAAPAPEADEPMTATAPPKRPDRPARRESAAPAFAPASFPTIPSSIRLDIPELLRAERLQVSDLDVNRLNVSELKANKITVSEIDGMSLGVSEIHSKSGSLSLGGVELPSDLIQQLLPLSSSLSHALTQSLSDSLAQSLQQSLSQIQEALSQPTELIQQQQELQQQLQTLQSLQQQQHEYQQEQLQQQQQFHQQQHQLQQQQLLHAEQQQAAVLQQLQEQLRQLHLQPVPMAADVPPPIPPPPRPDGQSIQTQTSLESPPPPEPPRSYSPECVPSVAMPHRSAPLAPPRSGTRPRTSPVQFLDSEEEIPDLMPAPSPSHSLRRRRHHAAQRMSGRFSSDEGEDDHQPLAMARRHRSAATEPTIGDVGRTLVRACRASTIRALSALHDAAQPAIGAFSGDPKRRDLQAALCLVVILVAALILLGCSCAGSRVQHHHHWDFQFPPPL